MAGHPGFLKLLDEMRELHCRKAADYGRGVDPFANVRASAEFGIPAWVGVMVRAGDKLHRIKSFIANGSLQNESVEDSLLDLAAYSLIALTLFREDRGEAFPPPHSSPPEPALRRRRVYIAGPISKGDLSRNIDQATEAFIELLKAGYAPHCPHWSAYAKPTWKGVDGDVFCQATSGGFRGATHEDWMGVDLAWVACSDAVLRLPGQSVGADLEVREANRLGIPVYYSTADLLARAGGATVGAKTLAACREPHESDTHTGSGPVG